MNSDPSDDLLERVAWEISWGQVPFELMVEWEVYGAEEWAGGVDPHRVLLWLLVDPRKGALILSQLGGFVFEDLPPRTWSRKAIRATEEVARGRMLVSAALATIANAAADEAAREADPAMQARMIVADRVAYALLSAAKLETGSAAPMGLPRSWYFESTRNSLERVFAALAELGIDTSSFAYKYSAPTAESIRRAADRFASGS